MHVSYHFGAANSRALEIAGVTCDTPDPAGGRFRRGSPRLLVQGIRAVHRYPVERTRILRERPVLSLVRADSGTWNRKRQIRQAVVALQAPPAAPKVAENPRAD